MDIVSCGPSVVRNYMRWLNLLWCGLSDVRSYKMCALYLLLYDFTFRFDTYWLIYFGQVYLNLVWWVGGGSKLRPARRILITRNYTGLMAASSALFSYSGVPISCFYYCLYSVFPGYVFVNSWVSDAHSYGLCRRVFV